MPSMIDATYQFAGVDISAQRLLALGGGVVILAGLWLFMQYTRLGIGDPRHRAGCRGGPVHGHSVRPHLFAGDGAVGRHRGVRRACWSRRSRRVIPSMGLLPLVKAFAIVVVGGLGSIPGSIVGALLLGYSETIIAFEVSIEWSQIVSVAAVFTTLVLRPSGFFGKRASF